MKLSQEITFSRENTVISKMALNTNLPTMEELRQFSRLQWVRCPSCNKPITDAMQKNFDQLLSQKGSSITQEIEKIYNDAYDQNKAQGMEDAMAKSLAEQKVQVAINVKFNKTVSEQLGIKRYCCYRTLQNPIILPIGSGIELSPEVDVGERMSTKQGQNKEKKPKETKWVKAI